MKSRCKPSVSLVATLLITLLSACSNTPSDNVDGGFSAIKDSGPKGRMDASHIPDAVPRHEVRTRAGNKSPYTVLGKTYRLMAESTGYSEKGLASWYGEKFHGRRTSNGEVYDMYGMTAAHKTIPIPSYLRVTNLNNGRQIIVRVNDRGPFHGDRIVDLSYAAATKLGFAQQGTASVRIEAVEPDDQSTKVIAASSATPVAVTMPAAPTTSLPKVPSPIDSGGYQLPENTFLQAGAFSTVQAAEATQYKIAQLTELPVDVIVPQVDKLFRVRVGPISDNLVMMALRELLEMHSLPNPHVVYE